HFDEISSTGEDIKVKAELRIECLLVQKRCIGHAHRMAPLAPVLPLFTGCYRLCLALVRLAAAAANKKGRQRPDSHRDTLPSRSYRDGTISADRLNYAVRKGKIPAAGTVAIVTLRFASTKKSPRFLAGFLIKGRQRPDSHRDTLSSRSYRDSTISADGLNYAVGRGRSRSPGPSL